MNTYIFKTTTTMKDYNSKKWWIDPRFVEELHITAEDIEEALNKYAEVINNVSGITISKRALDKRSIMYKDMSDGESKQIGYVITGKTEFANENDKLVEQYVDLWVEILTVVETVFPEG